MKTFFAVTLFFSVSAFSGESPDSVVRTRLCEFWKYNVNSGSYTCSFIGPFTHLVEADKNEQRIADLEARIEHLESTCKK